MPAHHLSNADDQHPESPVKERSNYAPASEHHLRSGRRISTSEWSLELRSLSRELKLLSVLISAAGFALCKQRTCSNALGLHQFSYQNPMAKLQEVITLCQTLLWFFFCLFTLAISSSNEHTEEEKTNRNVFGKQLLKWEASSWPLLHFFEIRLPFSLQSIQIRK